MVCDHCQRIEQLRKADQRLYDLEIVRLVEELRTAKEELRLRPVIKEPCRMYGQPVIEPGMTISEVQKLALLESMTRHDGKKEEVAHELGIALKTVYLWLQKYGLENE